MQEEIGLSVIVFHTGFVRYKEGLSSSVEYAHS